MPGTRPSLLRLLALLCALAGALTALPARADNTADEADLRFRRGVDYYRASRFEDALAEFFHSNRLVKNRNVILNIARCYEQLKLYEEAYRYYADVLAENPDGEDRKVVESSLARLAPRVALVQVTSEPAGAEIFVERKDLGARGVTPKTLALPPGETAIILALPGHREATKKVQLTRGSSAQADFAMEFIYGSVSLGGEPAGAEVRVDRADGEAAGKLPGRVQLRPGKHVLNVSAPGYVPAQLPVEVAGDQVVESAVTLQELPPPTGNVVVTANHDGALVQVDGKDSGFTPAVLPLPVGEHRITVTMPDMRPFEQKVVVAQDARSWVKAELRFAGAKTTAASKSETSVEEAPASITVITREEIRAFGYSSLPEALRGVRGMFFSNDRNYEYVGVRGFSPPGDLNSRILVLYDGHPMNDIYAGQAYLGHDNNVDMNEVERIEVVRGPVSSLFGSAAFFGVINIVPRHDLGERKAEASGATGTLGLVRARATGALKGEEGAVIASVGALSAAGEEIFVLPSPQGAGETLVRDRDGELGINATARARWKGFTLLGAMNSRTKRIPTGAFESLVNQGNSYAVDQRGFLEGRYERRGELGSLDARAYYDATRYRGQFAYEDGVQVERGAADWAGAEVRYRSRELLHQHLTLGAEFQRQFRIDQRVYVDGGLDDSRSFNVASAYIADELRLGSRVLLNGSARADQYFDSFGLTVNPRLALIVRSSPGGVTKLMGGRSFRAPSAYERFYHDGVIDPASGQMVYTSQRPNEEVGPEVILTGELEHSQEIGDELTVTGSLYVNRISDLIAQRVGADGLLAYDNASEVVRTEGAELEVRWQPARLAIVSASYWFQKMVVEGSVDEAEAQRLRANAPAHAFSLKGMFPIVAPLIVGSAEAVYNSDRAALDGSRTGEMLLLNLGLSGELTGNAFRYFAGVQNLLDERAQLPVGEEIPSLTLPSYGRTFVLQLTATY